MLKAMLGLGALLLLSWIMADKDQIRIERRKVDRWAKPLAFVMVPLALWLVIIPALTGG